MVSLWLVDNMLLSIQEHTKEELDIWKIVRVSEDFRVIALGLPVPRYPGNPLDPPLRSRFQARDVYCLPFRVILTYPCDGGFSVFTMILHN